MKPIDKNELYQHISQFFQVRGVELKDGPYTQGIQRGCQLFAEVVNASNENLAKAKADLDKALDKMRQNIHEKTAPKSPPNPPSAAPRTKARASKPAKKTPKATTRKKTTKPAKKA